MPLKVSFELSDADLRHFRRVMREARDKGRKSGEAAVLRAASRLIAETREAELPSFVVERIGSLSVMIQMLEDSEWNIAGSNRSRVIDALAYFAEPADLIPDQIPGIGFLDDAIMVELVVQELRHDLDAYRDFCAFRDEQRKARGSAEIQRGRLEARRKALHGRIGRRRERWRRSAASRTRARRTRSPFSLW